MEKLALRTLAATPVIVLEAGVVAQSAGRAFRPPSPQ